MFGSTMDAVPRSHMAEIPMSILPRMPHIFSLGVLFSILPGTVFAESAGLRFEGISGKLHLKTSEARKQLVVSQSSSIRELDVTGKVKFQVEPATVARVEAGFVTPLANGEATITARLGKDSAFISLVVSDIEKERAISFPNDVIPQLTRAGCNSGACRSPFNGDMVAPR